MDIINFISSDRLLSQIQEDLSSYDANNQLDPGRWYDFIKKIVSDLGIYCYERKYELVWLKNSTGKLPCNFQVLDSAFMVSTTECLNGCPPGEGPLHFQGKSIIWNDTTTACAFQDTKCNEGCEDYRTCTVNSFQEITVREYVRGLPYTYSLPLIYPLHINRRNSKSWCLPHSICFGSKAKDEISIANGTVYTNFDEGVVLLNYYAYPYDDEGLPMIPDNPKIQLAVEQYIKWKAFEILWTNGDDAGAQSKMLYFKNEFQTTSYPDAEYYVKLTSMSDMMNMARTNRRRLSIYQLIQK